MKSHANCTHPKYRNARVACNKGPEALAAYLATLDVELEEARKARKKETDKSTRGARYQANREKALEYQREYNRKNLRTGSRGVGYDRHMLTKNASKARRRQIIEAAVEIIDPLEVYETCEWICQLCFQPVDRTLRHPHRWSASLDHIIPLAVGGTHTRANVQLAHLSCNSRKQHRSLL